jgi:hypothetical protein
MPLCTMHNDIRKNNTKHYKIQYKTLSIFKQNRITHNNTQYNIFKHNDTEINQTLHNDIQ